MQTQKQKEDKEKTEQLLKLLKGLNPRNYKHKLQHMQRKHNELVAQKNIKSRRLEQLYKELDTLTHVNLQEDLAEIQVDNLQNKTDRDITLSK